jgi:hypothetical protein
MTASITRPEKTKNTHKTSENVNKRERSVPSLTGRKSVVGTGVGVLFVMAFMAAAFAAPGTAADEADSCLVHIANEEAAQSLPAGLLAAIGLTESGRMSAEGKPIPWPWTVNANGYGQFFESKDEAIEFVRELRIEGVTVIDVGCMQVNLHFHPDAFESLESAFDPAANVAYAARFLRALQAETGDWDVATRYYHSRTPALGQAYAQRVNGGSGGSLGAVASLSSKEKSALRAGVPDLMAVSDRQVATVPAPNRPLARWDLTASK